MTNQKTINENNEQIMRINYLPAAPIASDGNLQNKSRHTQKNVIFAANSTHRNMANSILAHIARIQPATGSSKRKHSRAL